ncbi:hypothetical protein BD770DRAFT_416290 [Pilaira anomala]|nr:hypothetical protein BD770DRAFT_416290 [Pilaira anomala]
MSRAVRLYKDFREHLDRIAFDSTEHVFTVLDLYTTYYKYASGRNSQKDKNINKAVNKFGLHSLIFTELWEPYEEADDQAFDLLIEFCEYEMASEFKNRDSSIFQAPEFNSFQTPAKFK